MNLDFFVGVFGFMQLSMIEVGLLDNKGAPIKKKTSMGEQDALAIYKWLSDKLADVDASKLRGMARSTDDKVRKLLNDHTTVNNFLLSLLILRDYIDNDASKWEQILISPKINRLVDVVDGAVSDDDFDVDIKKTTARTANNIYRQFVGKCQLSDEVRDANFKRMFRNVS